MQNEICDRLSAIAGVESVAFSSRSLPLIASAPSGPFSLEDKPGRAPVEMEFRYTSPSLFRTLGMRRVAGVTSSGPTTTARVKSAKYSGADLTDDELSSNAPSAVPQKAQRRHQPAVNASDLTFRAGQTLALRRVCVFLPLIDGAFPTAAA